MDVGILRALKTLKNHPYVQYVGLGFAGIVKAGAEKTQGGATSQRKTKLQLIRLSAAVCGIELCYAAETAFVSPILLKLGVPVSLMTMIWCLSPVLGFFLVPVMGSLSDRCPLAIGRRRPFILAMTVGIVIGLALVPNGEALGLLMGDNGTATLHHPKYFATANTSVRNRVSPQQQMTDNSQTRKGSQVEYNVFVAGGFQGSTDSRDVKNVTWSRLLDNSSLRERSYQHSHDVAGETWYSMSDKDGPRIFPDSGIVTTAGVAKSIQSSKYPTEHRIPDGVSASEDDWRKKSQPKSFSPFQLSEEHFRGIVLTILGVALLDFNCDACQSPCRAYLLDVSVPEDHSAGLTMFTVMAGLGGTVGYVMGGIDWNATKFGEAFGGHIRVVFTLVVAVFLFCVVSTVTSFKETPLKELGLSEEDLQRKKKKVGSSKYQKFTNDLGEEAETEAEAEAEEWTVEKTWTLDYGALRNGAGAGKDCQNVGFFDRSKFDKLADEDNPTLYHFKDNAILRDALRNGRLASGDQEVDLSGSHDNPSHEGHGTETKNRFGEIAQGKSGAGELALDLSDHPTIEVSADVTLKTYLRSIVHMPRCLWVLCLVNLFCWMSLVCYSLYFTDFVGQAVFFGDPKSPPGSDAHSRYDEGVRLGSFGMSLYSLSCSVYSLLIEKLVRRFRAKRVYVIGQLVFTVGMAIMAAARHKVAVVLLSPTAGIMYATLFTMPYLLVAHYHTSGLFSHGLKGEQKQVRGLGTDVAIVSSMVFLAQFLLSVAMGTIVYAVSSTTAVMIASAVLSSLGALTATRVTYLDL